MRKAGAIHPGGPDYSLQPVASSVITAMFVSDSVATELQVLSRLQAGNKERVIVTFHDRRGGLVNQTAHYSRSSPIVVGEVLPWILNLEPAKLKFSKFLGTESSHTVQRIRAERWTSK